MFQIPKFILKIEKQIADKNTNKLNHPKHILALLKYGQKCIFLELKPIELANFDLVPPACTIFPLNLHIHITYVKIREILHIITNFDLT